MLEKLNIAQPLPLAVDVIVFNIFIGAILAFVIKFHFKKFSSTLTNKNQFSNIFPIILLTTLLVISIVKSSLALSLGLVGALSIVRFRAAIKEPEELVYLFLVIAIGIATGAGQLIPAIILTIFSSGFIYIKSLFQKKKNIYNDVDILNLECPKE